MKHFNAELRGLELQTGQFSLRHIKAATKNFHPANKIGEGGFGPVYKVRYVLKKFNLNFSPLIGFA